MESFYTDQELLKLGLNSYGTNVRISRYARLYSVRNITIGSNVRIDDFCILSGKITLGNNIHIAAYSALYGGIEGIEIDHFCNLSSRVSIYAISDDYSGMTLTNPTIPKEYKELLEKKVVLEKHVIIGPTSVVLPGLILREGSSFGAMSFINKSSDPWSIYIGIPAKKLKERSKNLLFLENKFLDENTNEKD